MKKAKRLKVFLIGIVHLSIWSLSEAEMTFRFLSWALFCAFYTNFIVYLDFVYCEKSKKAKSVPNWDRSFEYLVIERSRNDRYSNEQYTKHTSLIRYYTLHKSYNT